MIYEYFISRSVTQTNPSRTLIEIFKVELKNVNEQWFITRWDETIITMKKQIDKEILDNLCYRQMQQSEQVKPLLSLYIQDTVQKG